MSIKFSELKKKFSLGEITKAEFISESLKIHQLLFDYVEVTKNSDVHEITISPDGVYFSMDQYSIKMFAPENEARVAPIEVMNFSKYEPEETRVMDFLTDGAEQILDIGANIGWYSVWFAKRQKKAQIYSFEPMPINYRFLQKNIAANQVGGQVSSYNYGLSDASGTFDFYSPPYGGVNASLRNVSQSKDVDIKVCLTLTLDQWVENQKVKPDFIKCDVEGAELLVFRGGRSTLAMHKPIIFSELLRKWAKPFGYHPNEMLDFFDGLGYVCFSIGLSGVSLITAVTDETIETNYVFLHSKAHVVEIEKLKYWNSQHLNVST